MNEGNRTDEPYVMSENVIIVKTTIFPWKSHSGAFCVTLTRYRITISAMLEKQNCHNCPGGLAWRKNEKSQCGSTICTWVFAGLNRIPPFSCSGIGNFDFRSRPKEVARRNALKRMNEKNIKNQPIWKWLIVSRRRSRPTIAENQFSLLTK